MWFSLFSRKNNQCESVKLMSDKQYEENAICELFLSIIGKNEHTLPTIVTSLMESLAISNSDETVECLTLMNQLKEELNSLLGVNGIFIFPSYPTKIPYHNQSLWTNPLDQLTYYGIFNALGLPSTQVCVGLDSEKLPVGIQLVTNCYCDKLTIRIANLIETELGGWVEP